MSRFPAARFLLSAAAPAHLPPDSGAEVACAGRSNAGKSSAINALTGRRALARTSKTPGRTQLLNYFELAPGQRIVDLPGYGYAEVPAAQRRTWPALLAALRERSSLRGLLLVVDARRGLGPGDEALLEWAAPHRVHVLLAKADKLTHSEARRALADAEAALGERASAQLFSAHAGSGVPHAQELLAAWLK
ncbi:MAG: YihA family ribosome biogenesis GTP-binding protein [Gammaproteobacteria bacterium]|nr:YihA family ribosome biogenesis GTP-binding protein [Gammaproteobacteria bacterium]MBV9696350.1 YihA family ribosome biogenesis GTP-binding protein [Gammaproteobacteria bacterium]